MHHSHHPGHQRNRLSVSMPPFPFGRICFVVLVMRKGGESSRSIYGIQVVHWKFSMCTATRTSSYSLVGPSFFVYLAQVCALCVDLCFLICFCVPFLLCFPGQLSHISLTVFGASVTNLNEPPRALDASTDHYIYFISVLQLYSIVFYLYFLCCLVA